MDYRKLFLLFGFLLSLAAPTGLAQAKKKPLEKKGVVLKLNKQTNDELSKNEGIQNCYRNDKAGKQKQHGVIYIDLDVGMHNDLNSVVWNKNQSTLGSELGACIVESLKDVIIPFKSNERGKKITVVFRF